MGPSNRKTVSMLAVAVLLGSLGLVGAIRCYQCSSLLEPRCGSTWTFEGDDAEEYLVMCPGSNARACDKILGDIQGNGDQHTYRMCWNQTIDYEALPDNHSIEYFVPNGCTKDRSQGAMYCHCITDGCNGAENKMAASWWFLIAAIFSVVSCSL